MTIRAILEHGSVRLLEPLPPGWTDGQELQVEALAAPPPEGSADSWAQEMATLAAKLDRPEEWAELEMSLAEADRREKARMRLQMGLPE